MSSAPEPRLIRPEEFDPCMALVNDCFGHDRGHLEARMPHCFDAAHPERHAVIERNGEIVSHVACVPAQLRAGDARIDCGGIAGVATHPDHRGNGHMRRLLSFWLDRLVDRGVSLAELEGDRVRYGRYGWENAGREHRYRIGRRAFRLEPAIDAVRRYRSDDLEIIREIHERERFAVVRDRRRYERLLDQTGLETLVVDGPEAAYCCHRGDPPTILEFGGASEGVAALLSRLLEGHEEIVVYTHPAHPLASLFRDVATEWEGVPHRKLNLLDLPTTVEAYEPLLAERWKRILESGPDFGSCAPPGDVTLAVENDGESVWTPPNACQSVTLRFERDGLRVDRANGEPDVSLGRAEMVDFLFGPSDARPALGRSRPALDLVLPLEYYFWQTETI